MLRFSNRLINATQSLTRKLSQHATRTTKIHTSLPAINHASSRIVSQINADFEKLRITTPDRGDKSEIVDIPIVYRIIENPRDALLNEIRDIIESDRNQVIENPSRIIPGVDNGIQAARLIVIRRRKMKKHKLKKLRKKMKFEWAKVRQRREMRKEKRFQAGLLYRIKRAEEFSAEAYVNEKLRLANETPIPRFWKGKRLPQFIIKEKMGIK